ncbi:hypothetical protein [Breoghania sp. L-A4]|uniref:hypothetical protein n=1 Tax=Breoghania sp. L-A4 TaxID=2304600 RepID=UPI000E3589E7|nr:hypothetical protein [Breoghania sp. L-A4]AXS38896.1 hypothetical protein D1F64_00995 [Breoghania sp. L-A4]
MWTRIFISVLVFMQINAVLFGAGIVAVLVVPALKAQAMMLLPAVVVASLVIALPVSWWLAPRLRLPRWRRRRHAANAGQ